MSDLARLHEFLAKASPAAAPKALRMPSKSVTALADNPRLGERLLEFAPREVRKLVVGQFELRYEIQQSSVLLLRIWHTRESR